MPAYSFLDVMCAISGPGGTFTLSPGDGNAEEGVTVTMAEDKDTMTIGADGVVMHSLHAAKPGTVAVRLLKISPTNAQLAALYGVQALSAATWGVNTITINDLARGDNITARQAAFVRMPAINYAKIGGTVEWVFNAGFIDIMLGAGIQANSVF